MLTIIELLDQVVEAFRADRPVSAEVREVFLLATLEDFRG